MQDNALQDIITYLMQPDWPQLLDMSINGLLIIVGAYLAAKIGAFFFAQLLKRSVRRTHFNNLSESDIKKRRDTLVSISSAIWAVLVVIVAIYSLVRLIFPGFDLAPLFASAGIVGIALGFGAQTIVKDVLSGLFILIENQYRVGDVVDLDGAAGTVEKITIRSTVVRDIDGNVHYIANGNIMHVINKTMGYSKVNLTIAVQPNTDVDHLTEIVNKVGEQLTKDDKWAPKILEAPHFLNIGNFTDMSMEVTITGKTIAAEQWGVTGELRKRLLKAFTKDGIHLAQLPGMGLPIVSSSKRVK